jgi:hypothetical protein
MRRLIDSFHKTEDGRAIVGWVVLTTSALGPMRDALITLKTGGVRHAGLTGQTMQDRGIPAI